MFCDQAQYFLLKLLFFNTIWYIYILPQDIDHKENSNEAYPATTTFIDVVGVELSEIQVGINVTLVCNTNVPNVTQWWTFNGENITENSSNIQIYYNHNHNGDQPNAFHNMYLQIPYFELNQVGNYTCNVANDYIQTDETVVLNMTIPHRVIEQSSRVVKVKLHADVVIYCTIEGFPMNTRNGARWLALKSTDEQVKRTARLSNATVITSYNETLHNITLHLPNVNRRDAGEYICEVVTNNNNDEPDVQVASEPILILILDKPQVHIDRAKALGVNTIFLNWTVNDGNDAKHLKYRVQYMEELLDDTSASAWYYYPEEIRGQETRAVLENAVFKKNTGYSLRMEAANDQGVGQKSNVIQVKTLDANPEFIPEVKVTGVTVSSITVSWSPLPSHLIDHIHYYQLKLWSYNSSTPTEAIHSTPGDHLYMFRDLIPATLYEFQVAACNEYTKKCSPWSNVINGTTLDGISDPPENVSLDCRFDNISHTCFVYVAWQPPKNSNGKIIHYNLILEGGASFINDQGTTELLTWGPKMTSVGDTYLGTRFYNISANTNYTVKISAVTRMKKHGKHVVLHCAMPPTIPDKNKLSRYSWAQVQESGKWIFKLFLPRISERNGAICCYRIYIIRMELNKGLAELPSAEDLHIVSYHEAHRTAKGGAYVADMFSGENYQSEIFLGDDHTTNFTDSPCIHCTGISSNLNSHYDNKKESATEAKKTNVTENQSSFLLTTTMTTTTSVADILNNVISDDQSEAEASERITRNIRDQYNFIIPFDGSLDMNSNYTGFVEVVVYGQNGNQQLTAYSNYFDILNPGPELVVEPATQVLGIVVQILCALILIILILFMALCVLHRYTKQVGHVQGIEMITFRNSFSDFRHLCRSLRGRHRLVSVSPPDMSPIVKNELPNVYMERHRDSDYGFQREFELLPDKFSDRTTRASESRENMYKNRYPDIKAYDQSRVKLSQIDSIAGSDYINANFVIGYKERKKFICAQGPMENTVSDYWRMIWEQHLELILMLTNLEEYSKTKCAKYWPDKSEGEKIFGDITVAHMDEKRYSDYIIRHLRVSKKNNYATTATTAATAINTTTTITATTNNSTKPKDERYLTQYHYLVWKDFMAPEHPHGIIKFIKRVNEAYSLEKGSILVHCSAGVGRTGTLVALDSLLQQLNEEGQVAIFNTVCDLRHQRNFLVQSLKQYIFIYRALMEVAQYGDTEIQVTELKSFFDKLKRNETGKSKMEEDYEKIKNTIEDRKSYTVGSCHENDPKNRSDSVIPYDRNRVILTPIPGSEHSTYINASFIEGYDNSESFIITQDPLETTIADFWRMTSEQGISVIVMLSNLGGENIVKKCPRYWPDDEITYNHIVVKYIQSESCPYYTRREFLVTNNKSDENIMVTQFQYHGWPTVEGEVPEVTRGLIELVDQTHLVQDQQNYTGPLVIHCNCGSDRSSMFVGLSILVQQLKIEKRVDIFTTTRKLRSQRQGMISTFAQYEFLHRAIVNYSDLHQLCEHS